MTEKEADNPPADYETRMCRALNLGAEADWVYKRYRANQEEKYWGKPGSKKRTLMRATEWGLKGGMPVKARDLQEADALLRRAMGEVDREFGS